MNNLQNKKIAIIGAGPGGLTLARLLQLKDADVTVYERDEHKDARAKGATLDLHEESGLRALREAGLMDAFEKNFRPGADRLRITDQHATILLDEHAAETEDRSRPEIDRGPLQNILLDSLLPGTVMWDRQFIKLITHNNGWNIEFNNGHLAYADIVIAADGANSKIRQYITPIRPFYSGVTVVEGSVYDSVSNCPGINGLLAGGKIFALGNSKSLIVSSKGDGSLVFYTGCNVSEDWSKNSGIDFSDKAQVLAWFKNEFTGWAPAWYELFENASSAFIPRPQYCMPFDQNWETLSNLTMLGDAAHLMPPYAGEGVNMAMLDAAELVECLANEAFEDSRSAIAAYENQMKARASEVAQITMQSTAELHGENALSFLFNIVG